MKLLLDTCVSPRTRDALVRDGHDVIWTGDWHPDPGDSAIMEAALREDRVLVTLDKDFGLLAVVFGRSHCGIVRLADIEPPAQAAACRGVIERYGEELRAGAIATVTKGRIRLRPAESGGEPAPQSDA